MTDKAKSIEFGSTENAEFVSLVVTSTTLFSSIVALCFETCGLLWISY